MEFITWFKDISKDDVAKVGGKSANLGEMFNIGLPVPPGFVVNAGTYKYFIEKTGIKDKIISMLSGLNVEDTKKLQETANNIQKLIIGTKVPEDIKEAVIDAYEIMAASYTKDIKSAFDLVKKTEEPFVAARSSATAEDLPSISEDEHILITIDGKPVYKKMKDLDSINPEVQDIKIPAMENNKIKWKKVEAIYKHPAKGKNLYKIKTVTGRKITISPNHSLIVLDEDTLQPKVTKINKLKSNEKVPVISKLPEINNPEASVDILEYIKGNDVVEIDGKVYIKNNSSNWSIQNPLVRRIPFSKDFAYFLGIYAAEGTTYKNNGILVTNSDPEIMERAISFFDQIGIYNEQKINKNTLRVYCKPLVRFLHAVAGKPSGIIGKGKLCSVKRVPDFIFGWKKELIAEFLKGAFDGDGGIEKGGIGYCSTSPILIGGIIKLLEFFGLEFTLTERRAKKDNWSNHQRILVPVREAINFKEKIGFESINKSRLLDNLVRNHTNKSYYPEFKHTISVAPKLAKKIKREYEINLPKEKMELSFCPSCERSVQKSSKYKGKERFYCSFCHKAYYEDEVIKRIEKAYKYYDEKGRFSRGMSPWNRGILSGTFSQKKFSQEMGKLGIKEFGEVFNGSVHWDKIKDVEEIPYDGWVYDFTVPNVQNFAAGVGGIITHNSASFAGQQATFLNVKGDEQLIKAVSGCWASLYTARAIYYRVKNDFEHSKVFIAVVVQKMINSEKAGVMFSINPATNNDSEIAIEAVWGLGETIVGGEVNPDLYIVDKNNLQIKHVEIKEQKKGRFRDKETGKTVMIDVPEEKVKKQILNEKEVVELAKFAKKVEAHYGKPQDMEWAIERNNIYIVQSRAVTTFKPKEAEKEQEREEIKITSGESGPDGEGKVIVHGLTASPGIASGKVKIVHDMSELDKVGEGDVLVAEMTNPDMVPAMKKAEAIVTQKGGMTCHAAIVSREMGIPCIVGAGNATSVLKENQIVTVDATHANVYDGAASFEAHKKSQPQQPTGQAAAQARTDIVTATEIKVIADLPDFAQKAASTGADGVGLVRVEFMIAENGIHPAKYIRDNKDEEYTDMLAKGIGGIARAFNGKSVWVRTSDIRSDEYKNLEGADQEPEEADPMIGWHAIRRGLDEPRILKAEFNAIKKLHDSGIKNVGVMIPFVIRVDELRKAKEIMRQIGLEPCRDIDFGVMVETPAACWVIEDLCKEGISFVSFGTNDLTQLTLGIDRNNERIAKLFDEMHPAVLGEIAKVIKVCKKHHVKTSICGQAGSRPEMAEFLVMAGIDSISANPDAVQNIRKTVAHTERKLLLDVERRRMKK